MPETESKSNNEENRKKKIPCVCDMCPGREGRQRPMKGIMSVDRCYRGKAARERVESGCVRTCISGLDTTGSE